MLNADNTVLRAASYADGPPSPDTLFFATTNEPPHELSAVPVVAPDIAPPVGCIAAGRAEELLLLFTDAKWLESDSPRQKMPVEVRVRIESLGRIRAQSAEFGMECRLDLIYPISRLDAADYFASSKKEEWRPRWEPPRFTIANPAIGDWAPKITYSSVYMRKQRDAHGVLQGHVVAHQIVHIQGDFHEDFELDNYPFDTQPLNVVLETEPVDTSKVRPANRCRRAGPADPSRSSNSAWRPSSRCCTISCSPPSTCATGSRFR